MKFVAAATYIHFAFALILWIFAGYFSGGVRWFNIFFQAFLAQAINGPIFPFTLGMAWITFLVILYFRKNLGLRGSIVAGCAPFGGAGLYELTQNCIGLLHGWRYDPMGMIDLTVWIVLGMTGVYYWKFGRLEALSILLFIGLFLLWNMIGYPQVTLGTFQQFPMAYYFNIFLKVLAFFVFLIPLAYRQRWANYSSPKIS